MISQVTFTADKKLKEQALKKAKIEGITLKALLTYSMKSFVEGDLSFRLLSKDKEPLIEELFFDDPELMKKAQRVADLLN
ncbi:MAG: hypothetical protein RBS56_02555 [Candidatus Gracilibacteria bacterium]|jgi:hypothetical protein|nr:hypothetical protein [Candidatus Gracilibacteria bacterium]